MADADIARALAARNRAGDLEMIPVEQEDTRPFLQRLKDALASGGWQDPQPGQRGTFVPGKVRDDGKVSAAVPGLLQQPAEGLYGLMTAPLSHIVRSGDRDAIRAASETSFDVASMLPAAGVAAGRTMSPKSPANHAPPSPQPILQKGDGPFYRGALGRFADDDPGREAYWATNNRDLASEYASRDQFDTSGVNTPRVQEVYTKFHNPMTHDARGQTYMDIDTDGLSIAAAGRGHDGLVIKNVVDPPFLQPTVSDRPPPADVVAALKRGTVFDRWGNQIFSNPDDPTTAAILALLQAQQGGQHQP